MIKRKYSIIKIIVVLVMILNIYISTSYSVTSMEPVDLKLNRVQAGIKMVNGEYVAVVSVQLNDTGEFVSAVSDMEVKRNGNIFSVGLTKARIFDSGIYTSYEKKELLEYKLGKLSQGTYYFNISSGGEIIKSVPFNVPLDENKIKVFLNDKNIDFDVNPVIVNNRVLVPFRKIFESLGAEVSWDENDKTVKSSLDNINITLKVGEDESTVNDKNVLLDCSPQIINGRVFIPLRFICESIGANVEWYDLEKSVYIDTTNKKILEPALITEETKALLGNSIGSNYTFGSYVAVMKDDYIYYINYNDGNKLYRIKKDFSENMKIYDAFCNDISLSDKYIIVTRDLSNISKSAIVRINLDGTGEEIIANGLYRFYGLYNNYIFYQNDHALQVRIKDDKTQRQVLDRVNIFTDKQGGNEDIDAIILGNWVFKNGILRRYKIINKESGTFILEGPDTLGNASGVILDVQDDWIYFRSSSDSNRLKKIKTDGTSETFLSDDTVCFAHYYGGYIYFYEYSDKVGRLVKAKPDGSMRKVLAINNNINDKSDISKIGVKEGCFYYIIGDNLYSTSLDGTQTKIYEIK